MSSRVEHVLDRLEARFTQRREGPPPKWLLFPSPLWTLKPTDDYTLRLCCRTILVSFAPVCIFMLLGTAAPLVYLRHRYPWFLHRALFHRGQSHRLLIGLLAHLGYYWLPYYLLVLLVFDLTLRLPTRYFWNRRARRLRTERPPKDDPPAIAPADPTVWPPAPAPGRTFDDA